MADGRVSFVSRLFAWKERMSNMKKQRAGRLFLRFGLPILILVFFAVWVVKLNDISKTALIDTTGRSFERGVVTQILKDNVSETGTRDGEQVLMVRMTSGPYKGQEIQTTSSAGYLFGAQCTVGMHVILIQSVAGDEEVTTVYSPDRSLAIACFAFAYLALLVLIGGKQGLKGALGLIFDFVVIIFVYLPLIYRGYNPLLTAVFLCCLMTVLTMYLIGGPTRKTLVATLGCMAGVVLAYVMAVLFGLATDLSGWNVSDIESLLDLWYTSDIQVGDLLFAGILISAIGAVMDVAMSVTSSMQEVLMQNPAITKKELFASGMRVGRDMMGTDSNTLILAFAGGSLSTLVLDYAYDLPAIQILNSNIIGIDIMKGLAGSFGVVLCVPFTVLLGSILLRQKKIEEKAKEEKSESAPVQEVPAKIEEKTQATQA